MSRILITGAGGGIARAILPVLNDLGHSMLLTTRSRTAALESFLKDAGIHAPIFQADLTVESDVEELFEWVAENGGLLHLMQIFSNGLYLQQYHQEL